MATSIEDFCEQAGCNDKKRKLHFLLWRDAGWHSHPSQTFVGWWSPNDRDPQSGASIGGHPDALRRWARKDPGGWRHRWYGVFALEAWNVARYRDQFEAWEAAGSPEPDGPFISLAASLERQKKFWHDLKPMFAKIAKPVGEIVLT